MPVYRIYTSGLTFVTNRDMSTVNLQQPVKDFAQLHQEVVQVEIGFR